MIRFWWASDTDLTMTKARLDKLKTGQLSSWSWSRWIDPGMSNSELEDNGLESPCMELLRDITMPSVFDDGRVVYTYGIPDFQDKLAAELKNIPENVLFILIAKPEKNLTLYKRAKDLEKKSLAKLDDYSPITGTEAVNFIKERAKYYGADIEQVSCKMLIDYVGLNENMLDQEIKKLAMAADGNITPILVQEGCFSDGDVESRNLPEDITRDKASVREMMRRARLQVSSEDQFMGLFLDWAQKLCIADFAGRNIDKIDKEKLSLLKKAAHVTIKCSDGSTKKHFGLSINDFNLGKILGEPGKLIANPSSLYYSCKSLQESGRKMGWSIRVMEQLFHLYVGLRTHSRPEDRDRLWQQFIDHVNEMPLRLEI